MVDTSQLIKNERDIFTSKKVACILLNEQLHNLIVSSPTKNILWRIFERTRLRPDMTREREILGGERCLFTRSPDMFQLLRSDIFLVGERSAANLLFSAFYMAENLLNKLWFNENIKLYEYNKVLYYSLRQKENKERIERA